MVKPEGTKRQHCFLDIMHQKKLFIQKLCAVSETKFCLCKYNYLKFQISNFKCDQCNINQQTWTIICQTTSCFLTFITQSSFLQFLVIYTKFTLFFVIS